MPEKYLHKISARIVKFLMTGTTRILCHKALTPCDRIDQNAFSFLVKGKEIPLQAWTGPEGSRRLRLPDFKTTCT
jgi:hypothetical protein